MDRQYYKIKIPNPNSSIQNALNSSIGMIATQRYSLDGKYVIIKTNTQRVGSIENTGVSFDSIFPSGLTTVLTYEEATELMKTPEWNNEIIV